MQVIRYRDTDGFILNKNHQLYFDNETPDMLKEIGLDMAYAHKADYVYCPETDGLRTIALCKQCKLYAGDCNRIGAWCISANRQAAPAYMNKTK